MTGDTEKLADLHNPEHVWIFTFGLGYFSAPARYIRVKGTYDRRRSAGGSGRSGPSSTPARRRPA